ncbi:MAG: hypothetical protein EOP13_26840 [Pseudomonas sp.]|uniref:hypothetical protein n=1 Tax=Pseudomonas sp. TaxID=306 RepID=UPI0011F7D90B|nr:hypothetical protein [Pseudomonas sp.]RZI68086.1 MAG: hypothetical protein EOP13_26840 [Pseudomonas sp.]
MSVLLDEPLLGDKPDHPLGETALKGNLGHRSGCDGRIRADRLARVGLKQARKIAARYAAGATLLQLATSYGLGVICIRRIVVNQGRIIRPPGTLKRPSKA